MCECVSECVCVCVCVVCVCMCVCVCVCVYIRPDGQGRLNLVSGLLYLLFTCPTGPIVFLAAMF